LERRDGVVAQISSVKSAKSAVKVGRPVSGTKSNHLRSSLFISGSCAHPFFEPRQFRVFRVFRVFRG
jgi:hypothetical protein